MALVLRHFRINLNLGQINLNNIWISDTITSNRVLEGDIMNRFADLNEQEMSLVKKAGYIIKEKKEYSDEDYEKCANAISDYIMNHSKNDIPKIQKEFSSTLRKII